jgi:hypothetical protein
MRSCAPCASCAASRACRRLGAGGVRRHARAVHGEHRRGRARLPARQGPGLGHGRIRHAAAGHAHARPREAAKGKQSGRTQEIQRLIGRSLRAGTRPGGARRAHRHARLRCAAGRWRHAHGLDHRRYVALADACARSWRSTHRRLPLHGQVAAISVGIVAGRPVLDLDYVEDSSAETDMNVVMKERRRLHRGAGHGRRPCVPPPRTRRAARSRRKGIDELFALQRAGARRHLNGRAACASCSPPATPASSRVRRRCWRRWASRSRLQSVARHFLPRGNRHHLRGQRAAQGAACGARIGLPALADDSGLEVDALGGRPVCGRRATPDPMLRATRPTTRSCWRAGRRA